MTEPILTRAEEKIAAHLADGLSCARVAAILDLKKRTVYNHIVNIAGKIANPDELKPYQLVSRWAFLRREKRKLSA